MNLNFENLTFMIGFVVQSQIYTLDFEHLVLFPKPKQHMRLFVYLNINCC